ncbi:hypothetical protein BKA60DRAFT_602841 [Fusarium oxysporum]|nr:hypothetical protein BKA60DRAFT_602841 [Fusarium oxysporum]
MRLLSAGNLQFKDFFGRKIPKYVILSHRWEEEELSYADMKTTIIYQFSLMALQARYKYIWSINSMYQWYMESGVCYVYLSDVSISTSPSSTRHRGPLSSRLWTESFQKSQWFTRGWMLQELLAPRDLMFFDKDWNRDRAYLLLGLFNVNMPLLYGEKD